ncbi:hypothetical protein CVIRNUC_007270 [Coccomyxa viridis]|uniref:Uncharacterized protein n=1 Tax=Coccomyxa viridis TaxID=1274662 RepID=A0AAV1IAE4_9CHLO|nr:hypothetical protein CVIRNUC_007270 [Coccomyxa viridis]
MQHQAALAVAGDASAAVPDAWASLKADVTLFRADDTVKEALLALSGEEVGAADHLLCKHLMEEAARPIEEALRFSRTAGCAKAYHEAAMLKDEVYLYICICTATQEMKRADTLLERALYNAEDIDMDSVFMAIDAYRNSILLTRS